MREPKFITNFKNFEADSNNIILQKINTLRDFEEYLQASLQKNTKQISDNNNYIPKYWWNDRIKNLWHIKNQKLNLFIKFNNTYTKIEYKKSKAKLKLNIKKVSKKIFTNSLAK